MQRWVKSRSKKGNASKGCKRKIKQREKERELGVPKIQNICEQDAKIVRRNERFPLDLIIKSHKPTKQLLVLGALALLSKF